MFDRQYTLSGAQDVATLRPESSIRWWSSPRLAERRRDSARTDRARPYAYRRAYGATLRAARRRAVAPFLNFAGRPARGIRSGAGERFPRFRAPAGDLERESSAARSRSTMREGQSLEAGRLAPEERIAAILRWSALPGASRHHWGTDLDLIDRGATASGYRVQLTAAEYAAEGRLDASRIGWRTTRPRFGFFRPSAVCCRACSRNPGISASRRWRSHARRALTCETAARGARRKRPCSARSVLAATRRTAQPATWRASTGREVWARSRDGPVDGPRVFRPRAPSGD